MPIPAPKRDTLDVRMKRELRHLIHRAALAREKNRIDFMVTARK